MMDSSAAVIHHRPPEGEDRGRGGGSGSASRSSPSWEPTATHRHRLPRAGERRRHPCGAAVHRRASPDAITRAAARWARTRRRRYPTRMLKSRDGHGQGGGVTMAAPPNWSSQLRDVTARRDGLQGSADRGQHDLQNRGRVSAEEGALPSGGSGRTVRPARASIRLLHPLRRPSSGAHRGELRERFVGARTPSSSWSRTWGMQVAGPHHPRMSPGGTPGRRRGEGARDYRGRWPPRRSRRSGHKIIEASSKGSFAEQCCSSSRSSRTPRARRESVSSWTRQRQDGQRIVVKAVSHSRSARRVA